MAERADSVVDVSVLVTNWNGCDVLRECLRSLDRETDGVRYETVVVDDASTDGSVEMIRREFPAVRLLTSAVNAGFVRASNAGAEIAHGRYLLLLNSDTVLVSNAVRILAEYLDSHDYVGACGGLLLNPDGSSQISFGSAPSLRQALADALFLNDLFPRLRFPARGMAPDSRSVAAFAVEYVSGADLMIRREIVERSGLFDTSFEAYCEEVDLCERVRREAGAEVYFVPGARILHIGGYSYRRMGTRRIEMQCRSYHTFLRKYHGKVYSETVTLLFAWHYAVKCAFRLVMWALASGAKRTELKERFTDAWLFALYSVRSSLPYHIRQRTLPRGDSAF
jgi:GT2 family glycosyltransferase